MKKLILSVVLIITVAAANAQEFKIGLGGGIYSTWLTNTNVSDQGDELDFGATFGGQIGLNMQYYFKDNLGINFGLLYSGHNQKYTGEFGSSFSYEAKTKMRYLDIPFLLRMGGGTKGAYFEFGPQFGFLMSAKDEYTSDPSDPDDFSDRNVKESFKSTNIAGILGFGVDIDASENVMVTTGLRLGYGFTDATKEYTEAEYAAVAAADELSGTTALAHIDDDNNFNYKSTNRAFGGLFISILYKIPAASK